jgi:parallel beta-helix repeat protein
MHTDYSIVEDNIVYDNWGLGIDLDKCAYATVRKNLIYYTADTTWWRTSDAAGNPVRPANGILISNEFTSASGDTYPLGHDRKIINNIIVGTGVGITFWPTDGSGGEYDYSRLINDLIAHNTLVEAQNSGTGIRIMKPPLAGLAHTDSRIANNIVLQSNGTLAGVDTAAGLTFDHNLWSRTPPTNVSGTGDVVGNPMLTDPNHVRTAGEVIADWYKLTTASPAMDKGDTLTEVAEDYFGALRSQDAPYDIGAHEYGGAIPTTPTFADVPFEHPFHDDIETLYQKGYTSGCATDPLRYCPETTMNRAESAVYVERGIHAATYDPPVPSSQVFADLPPDSWAAKWVNGLWQDQYTTGCGTNPLVYCPWQGHTRAEGCVFYLRMMNGATYEPPQPTTQTFGDVPLDAWYAKWVKAAYGAGLIPACRTTPELQFCPDDPLTRALAAHMMVQAKGLIDPP